MSAKRYVVRRAKAHHGKKAIIRVESPIKGGGIMAGKGHRKQRRRGGVALSGQEMGNFMKSGKALSRVMAGGMTKKRAKNVIPTNIVNQW